MNNLIAFTGKLGSGKDSAADRFTSLVSLPSNRISFARKLKESAAAVFGIDVAEWETLKNNPAAKIRFTTSSFPGARDIKPVATLTARELLQRYGTEAHRNIFGDSFWVDQAMVEFDSYVGPDCMWYCTDCRFENEAQAVKERGGIIVRVLGDNEQTGDHASEAGLPDEYIDFLLHNQRRDDNFASLDASVCSVAYMLDLPVITWV